MPDNYGFICELFIVILIKKIKKLIKISFLIIQRLIKEEGYEIQKKIHTKYGYVTDSILCTTSCLWGRGTFGGN